MANIKSQIKRNRQNEKRRKRNLGVRSSLKTATKKVTTAAETGDAEVATAALGEASRAYDKAASKGMLHKARPPVTSRDWPRPPTARPPPSRTYTGRAAGSPAIAATSIGRTTSSVAPDFNARSAQVTRSWRPASSSIENRLACSR